MTIEEPPSPTAQTIAQELGADPADHGRAASTGNALPTIEKLLSDLTRAHPLAMLGAAFLAGAVFNSLRRR
jgi:hypothetical protein